MNTTPAQLPTDQERAQQFEAAQKERDRLYARYDAARAEFDDENANLWFERWEVECARVENMRPSK